jgi:hypothetical protein
MVKGLNLTEYVKVSWQLPLFLFILSFTVTYIHNYIRTINTLIHLHHRGLSPFSSLLSLSGKNLSGVPSRDLNPGLPYSRPARYQLSSAAPKNISQEALLLIPKDIQFTNDHMIR